MINDLIHTRGGLSKVEIIDVLEKYKKCTIEDLSKYTGTSHDVLEFELQTLVLQGKVDKVKWIDDKRDAYELPSTKPVDRVKTQNIEPTVIRDTVKELDETRVLYTLRQKLRQRVTLTGIKPPKSHMKVKEYIEWVKSNFPPEIMKDRMEHGEMDKIIKKYKQKPILYDIESIGIEEPIKEDTIPVLI